MGTSQARAGSGPQKYQSSFPGPRPQGPHGLVSASLVLNFKKNAQFGYLPPFPKPAMGLMPSESSGNLGTRPLRENICIRDE